MSESDKMCSKILDTIVKLVKLDRLEDFEIIPVEENIQNKTPVVFQDRHLGLESWSVRILYNYICSVIFKRKQILSKLKPTSITWEIEDLNDYVIGALLLNPEVCTFWNIKRELLQRGLLDREEELIFCKLILRSKPKSYEAFSYRRWILRMLIDELPEPSDILRVYLQEEFYVADKASLKAPNNYHSWNHRIWCMENMGALYGTTHNVNIEIMYSNKFIRNHVSEHAAYHYRQYLVLFVKRCKKILFFLSTTFEFVAQDLLKIDKKNEYLCFLIHLLGLTSNIEVVESTLCYANYISFLLYDLFALVDELNKLYPEHEALFDHRKFLIYHLLKVPCDYHGAEFETNIRKGGLRLIEGKNICDLNAAVEARIEVDRWKLLPRHPELFKWYELVVMSERNFAAQNTNSLLMAKYKKWLTKVIGYK